jgi:hypothetical protein
VIDLAAQRPKCDGIGPAIKIRSFSGKNPKQLIRSQIAHTDFRGINLSHYGRMRLSIARASRTRVRTLRRSSLACFEYRPCLVTACRMRSIPAAVFGPVLRPP